MQRPSITAVEAVLVEGPRPWLFVTIETDEGIRGVGEIPRTRHEPEDVVRLAGDLIGADPFETEQLFGAGGRLGAERNDLFTTAMTGGLDMACWDIKGKLLDVPVYDLLGGACHSELRAYANGWDFPARAIVDRYHRGEEMEPVLDAVVAELTDAAVEMSEHGYTAVKFSPFQWGSAANATGAEIDAAIRAIQAVADAVPDHVDLLIEGHKNLGVGTARSVARRLEPIDPFVFEEPVPADIDPLRRVARASSIPIATGESFVTHHPFAELIGRTDVGVVQPDVGRAGGITELQKIAALASADRVGFAPHNAAGPVMTFAAAHLGASSPAFAVQETFETAFHPEWSCELLAEPLKIENGFIDVPSRPGLGVVFNEEILAEHTVDSLRVGS